MHILMRSLADENLSYQQIAKVIQCYPEITARLIFLANSSWSAPITPITNIDQACARLGTSIVKSVSIAISIASSFDTRKCALFDTVQFWSTSMLVADGSYALASKLPNHKILPDFERTAQTAGILHNLGLLWLADNLPTETNEAFRVMADESSNFSLSELLKQFTETDYCEIGGWLAEQLKLPEALSIAMKHHLNPEYQELSWETSLLVGEAAKMASALHNQIDELPTNNRLEILGIDSTNQKYIYQQLSNNFEKTCNLAKALFEG